MKGERGRGGEERGKRNIYIYIYKYIYIYTCIYFPVYIQSTVGSVMI